MAVGARLRSIIEANEPYWGAEALVIRSYWDSAVRTPEADLLWIARQAYKELLDGCAPALCKLSACIDDIDGGTPGDAALELAGLVKEELEHYVAFADAYRLLAPAGAADLDPEALRAMAWPENDALMALRAEHTREDAALGGRAHFFTEGGYCALYAEGMRRAGQGASDDIIAAACLQVYEDEHDHMRKGIAGLEDGSLSEAEWDRLEAMTVAQCRARIRMRNAQFSLPLNGDEIETLCAAGAEPLRFDYARQ